ncbi:unnamed protein product [Trichogramma brassicae]|uniref:Uncharacterized protein n=1 Tax=Trichogramma brassicae TaxID=86971 RepID=A0A6H5IE50_9HYME|nr:unnamed protein product [Trichogramma brassicae]
MMSESVTVTVQNGNEAGRGPAIAPLNVSYFSTTPGLCKVAQLIIERVSHVVHTVVSSNARVYRGTYITRLGLGKIIATSPLLRFPSLSFIMFALYMSSGVSSLSSCHTCQVERDTRSSMYAKGEFDNLLDQISVEFVICLTEEATSLFVARNRQITRTILDMVHQEINKRHSKPWQERGGCVDDGRLLASRDSLELNVALPLSQLCRPRLLGDRRPDDVRDGCVELVELYQRYECVAFTTIAKPSQTTLPYDEQWVQTYPGNPKNQWTQYEFVVPDEFLEIWKDDDKDEANSDEQGGEAQIENEDNEQEVSEEQLHLEEKRRSAREKLQQFLRNRSKDLLAEVSFNASTNLYKNDVANLSKRETVIETRDEHRHYYEEKVSLIDLNATKGKYLYAAAWHCKVEHIIVAAYADRMAKDYSLVAIWSLFSPLRPKIILDCQERISMLSFCPIEDYTNIMIGGRTDGKVVVWEINESLLVENEDETDSLNESTSNEPEHREARIAVSAEKSQRKCITGIQWLPTWCRIESDGNFQRNASCALKDRKVCFATSSAEGTIYFWPLPRALSRPATARSPLHLTIAPIYQLVIDDQDDKTVGPMALTCFSLPLAKSEESSNLSIRDDADLERLRKVFVGTSGGEVMTCTWESMTFSLDISDREVCKITHRCCLHDGPVRSMIKSPHLDDIFLTVGGRVCRLERGLRRGADIQEKEFRLLVRRGLLDWARWDFRLVEIGRQLRNLGSQKEKPRAGSLASYIEQGTAQYRHLRYFVLHCIHHRINHCLLDYSHSCRKYSFCNKYKLELSRARKSHHVALCHDPNEDCHNRKSIGHQYHLLQIMEWHTQTLSSGTAVSRIRVRSSSCRIGDSLDEGHKGSVPPERQRAIGNGCSRESYLISLFLLYSLFLRDVHDYLLNCQQNITQYSPCFFFLFFVTDLWFDKHSTGHLMPTIKKIRRSQIMRIKWKCTNKKCPARCSVLSDPHYFTFDGKKYDFQGKCSYYLVKGDDFNVIAVNGICDYGVVFGDRDALPGEPTCTRSVKINWASTTIELMRDRRVFVDGSEVTGQLPVTVAGKAIVRHISSSRVLVRLPVGLDVIWDGVYDVNINAAEKLRGKVAGMCGTFTSTQKDDFWTPDGSTEVSVFAFANKWKVDENCKDVTEEPKHTCDVHPEKRAVAEKYCSVMRNTTFESCKNAVDPEHFYQMCVYDMCGCESSKLDSCLCPTISAYAQQCAVKGIVIPWRQKVEQCRVSCPMDQEYQVCGNSCSRSCADVSLDTECEEQCVEGCNCPRGQSLDSKGNCVPIGQCPCLRDGKEFAPGVSEVRTVDGVHQVCKCAAGKWACEPFEDDPSQLDSSHFPSCDADKHLEMTPCEPAVRRSCRNMHENVEQSPARCQAGCVCQKGYVLESLFGVDEYRCIPEKDCPCYHGGRSYRDGETYRESCNTCQCNKGKWSCSQNVCTGVCSVWGDSHYTSFDGREYDFSGACEYVYAKGQLSGSMTFEVRVRNVACGTTGVTCSKTITLSIRNGDVQESVVLERGKELTEATLKKLRKIEHRRLGLFWRLSVKSLGLELDWDEGTRMHLRLLPYWKNKVQGLCGNYDDDQTNDYQTPSGGPAEARVEFFVDSWRVDSYCPAHSIDENEIDTCSKHPERKPWATKKCSVMLGETFEACHSAVAPEDYVKKCINDACACDDGGDCECLCTAISAYAEECNAHGIHIQWRKQKLCPLQCPAGQTYRSCIYSCPLESCENTKMFKDLIDTECQNHCFEGCEPEACGKGLVYTNSSYTECQPRDSCKIPCIELNGQKFYEGERVPRGDCESCVCAAGKLQCIELDTPTCNKEPKCSDAMDAETIESIRFSSAFPIGSTPSVNISTEGAWRPMKDNQEQFVVFTFANETVELTGIETKGIDGMWTSAYKVLYSLDGEQWLPVRDSRGYGRIFYANDDDLHVKRNMFGTEIVAKHVKIIPIQWHLHLAMKIQLLGCNYRKYEVPCNLCYGVEPEPGVCHCEDESKYWDGTKCVEKAACPCNIPSGQSSCDSCTCEPGGFVECKPKECPYCSLAGQRPTLNLETCECDCNTCPKDHKICPTNGDCIRNDQWCDGIKDCPDDEDKTCPPPPPPPPVNETYTPPVNEKCDDEYKCQKSLLVRFENHQAQLFADQHIILDDLPLSLDQIKVIGEVMPKGNDKIKITSVGGTLRIEYRTLKLSASIATNGDIVIEAPVTLHNKVVGMCGNFDFKAKNDLDFVHVEGSPNKTFAEFWKLSNTPECTVKACPRERKREAWKSCVAVRAEPFSSVTSSVDSTEITKLPHTTSWLKLTEIPSGGVNMLITTIQLEIVMPNQYYGHMLSVPSVTFAGAMEGLCGDCDNNRENDEGQKWLIESPPPFVMRETCVPPTPSIFRKCDKVPTPEQLFSCDALANDKAFQVCHAIHSYVPYLEECRRALKCGASHCQAIAAYAEKCSQSGLCIDWRKEYKACGSRCSKTCDDPNGSSCQGPKIYSEGCFCPEGQVLHNGKCVSRTQCSICDNDGHVEGDIWTVNKCKKCSCHNKTVSCTTKTCPRALPICRINEKLVLKSSEDDCCPVQQCDCMPKDKCPPVSRLEKTPLEEGYVAIVNHSGCCPRMEPVCKPEICRPPPICPKYYKRVSERRADNECCPIAHSCVAPKDLCLLTKDDKVVSAKKIGERWQVDSCESCVCELNHDGEPRIMCSKQSCLTELSHPDAEEYALRPVRLDQQCCPDLERVACKHNGVTYAPGQVWYPNAEDKCTSMVCAEEPEHGLVKSQIVEQCPDQSSCELGYEYRRDDASHECCGKCVQTACVHDGRVAGVNETWFSDDHCIKSTCLSNDHSVRNISILPFFLSFQ